MYFTDDQMDGKTGWWTTSGKIGPPPLARVMGVGRQQHQRMKQDIGMVEVAAAGRLQVKYPDSMLLAVHRLTAIDLSRWFSIGPPVAADLGIC